MVPEVQKPVLEPASPKQSSQKTQVGLHFPVVVEAKGVESSRRRMGSPTAQPAAPKSKATNGPEKSGLSFWAVLAARRKNVLLFSQFIIVKIRKRQRDNFFAKSLSGEPGVSLVRS